MAVDPVCNMRVDEDKAPSSVYKGKRYYFCNPGCQQAFDAHPEHYLANEQREPDGKCEGKKS